MPAPSKDVQPKISKPKKPFNWSPVLLILAAFVAGILGGIIGLRLFPDRITSLDTAAGQRVVSSQSELIASINKDVSPSVVSINVKSQSQQTSIFDQLLGNDGSVDISEGAGTGIILSSDGIIITNRHVIPANATEVSVTTSDGKTYDGVEVLARDPRSNYDIAFLKIKGVSDLKPAKIGDSSKMQVGDVVVAIGYALGEFQNTVTSGIISGLGRPITASDGTTAESLSNLFQTDAAINPGNSGGPLVNTSGEVIGINTAVAGNAQNIGFSIPTNDVKNQIESILKNGKLEIPYLGVRYIMLNEAIQQQFELGASEGAWLKGGEGTQAVITDSPADKAGLKEGDIITKVNGQKITAENPLANELSKYAVGEELEIEYLRGDKTQTTKATLEAAPAEALR